MGTRGDPRQLQEQARSVSKNSGVLFALTQEQQTARTKFSDHKGCYNRRLGAVDEWFKSHAWKACVG
jgi:hypothetical protein